MGTNSKLFLGFSSRPWRKRGYLGYFYSDGALQSGWDHTQTQDGDPGGLTVFQGGRAGLALGEGSPEAHADRLSKELEALYPGSRKARNGRAGVFHWPESPLALGSYSCYKVGQWTSIGGEEGKSVGDLHFAGEHCSADFQGYMNGAAESGRIAAERILSKWNGASGKES
jgi:monoamine oxidase